MGRSFARKEYIDVEHTRCNYVRDGDGHRPFAVSATAADVTMGRRKDLFFIPMMQRDGLLHHAASAAKYRLRLQLWRRTTTE